MTQPAPTAQDISTLKSGPVGRAGSPLETGWLWTARAPATSCSSGTTTLTARQGQAIHLIHDIPIPSITTSYKPKPRTGWSWCRRRVTPGSTGQLAMHACDGAAVCFFWFFFLVLASLPALSVTFDRLGLLTRISHRWLRRYST